MLTINFIMEFFFVYDIEQFNDLGIINFDKIKLRFLSKITVNTCFYRVTYTAFDDIFPTHYNHETFNTTKTNN